MTEKSNDVLIVGGGPAGMMAGLLFARAGLSVTVLEKHRDFLRDFRGDTVHPSTMEILAELGLLEEFLARPHDRVEQIDASVGGHRVAVADFRHLRVPARFIAMMPQWHFLDFLKDKAQLYPGFELVTECEGQALLRDANGRVSGVEATDGRRFPARLVLVCEGRDSHLREQAGLKRTDLAAPIDVFWLHIPKQRGEANASFGHFDQGRILVLIDRGDYWQCAFVFAKGGAEKLRAEGLDAFKARLIEIEPMLAEGLRKLASFDDVKLLSVTLDRLERWWQPGLLAIGDAAHAMSPVGGVGINLAIQDAVAAANILAGPMAEGADPDPLLQTVQQRRLRPVRLTQAMQSFAHRRFILPLIGSDARTVDLPFALRLLNRIALLRRIPARIIGLGFQREHVRSPEKPRA